MKLKYLIIIFVVLIPFSVLALMIGDINSDGTISTVDYLLIKKHILGTSTLNSEQMKAADINGDNKITSQDYLKIKKHVLNIELIATPTPTPKIPTTEEERICETVKNNASIDYKSFASLIKDGDDYYMIKAAHDCANTYNKPIVATKDVYNIYNKTTGNITVKTNTDLNNSTIYIHDESGIVGSAYNNHIYRIIGDELSSKDITLSSIKQGTIINELKGNSSGYYARVSDNSTNRKVYVRYGSNANSGFAPYDAFRVDKDGKIIDPIIWSYDNVRVRLLYAKIPSETLTFKNAHFFTIADTTTSRTVQSAASSIYLSRGIQISRSNTVLDNISHAIVNSNKQTITQSSHGYYGFYYINNAANITLNNIKVYTLANYNNYVNSTYDIIIESGVNILFKGAKAYDYDGSSSYFGRNNTLLSTDGLWGMVGSNGAKNVTYDDCVLNRIDSHTGAYNLTIKNSKIGRRALSLTGFGDLIIDNVDIYANKFIELRTDYGSTWNGKATITNSRIHPNNSNLTQLALIELKLSYDGEYLHNFGYDLVLPSIKMDNFTVDSTINEVYLFGNNYGATGKVQGNLSKVQNYIKNNEFKYIYPKKSEIVVTNTKNKNRSITIWNYIINFGEN